MFLYEAGVLGDEARHPREAAAIGITAVALGGDPTSLRAADDLRQLGRFAGWPSTVQEAADLKEPTAELLASRT